MIDDVLISEPTLYETTIGDGSPMEILTIPFEEYTLCEFFLFGIFCVLIVHVFFSLFNHK